MQLRLLALLLISFSLMFAQEDEELHEMMTGSDTLTVKKAVTIAHINNPLLKQLNERINAKKGEFWSSTGIHSPSLLLMKEGIPDNNSTGFSEKRWTISQSIDFPLKSYFRLKRIGKEEDALQLLLRSEELRIKSEVKKSYTEIIYALDILKLRREALEITKTLANSAKARVETGQASELESMNAEILNAEAQNDYADASRMLNKARYNLFNVMGLDPDEQKYSIMFTDSLTYVDFYVSQKEILEQLETQPGYLSVASESDAASFGKYEAWNSILPDISFSYYKQNFLGKYDHYGVELGLKIPLWFMFGQRGKIESATAYHNEIEWKKKETMLEYKKQIEHAWHSYETSKSTIKRYINLISVKANDLQSLTLEAYKVGQADLLTLLNAQRTYINSRIRYLDALKDYYEQMIELEKYLQKDVVFK